MKQRWEKYISKTLYKFEENSKAGEDDETDGSFDVSTIWEFRGGASYYTILDDIKILYYIVKNKSFSDVGGKAMWEVGWGLLFCKIFIF